MGVTSTEELYKKERETGSLGLRGLRQNVAWPAWPVAKSRLACVACGKKMPFACAALAFGHNAVGLRCLRP